jgi:hypothetical protein
MKGQGEGECIETAREKGRGRRIRGSVVPDAPCSLRPLRDVHESPETRSFPQCADMPLFGMLLLRISLFGMYSFRARGHYVGTESLSRTPAHPSERTRHIWNPCMES